MRELSIITKSDDEEQERKSKGLALLLESGTFLKYTDTMAKYLKEDYSDSVSTPGNSSDDEDLDR